MTSSKAMSRVIVGLLAGLVAVTGGAQASSAYGGSGGAGGNPDCWLVEGGGYECGPLCSGPGGLSCTHGGGPSAGNCFAGVPYVAPLYTFIGPNMNLEEVYVSNLHQFAPNMDAWALACNLSYGVCRVTATGALACK